MKKQITMLMHHSKISCFSKEANKWESFRLKGEEEIATSLSEALEILNDSLGLSTQLQTVSVLILSANSSQDDVIEGINSYQRLSGSDWQFIKLDLLRNISGFKLKDARLEELPKALLSFDMTSTDQLDVLSQQADKMKDTLQSLQQEKMRLKAEIQSLQGVPMDYLVTFLPAIYKHFWSIIRPDELAILAGSLEAPAIPSPYSEPSKDTVLTLRKKLKALPESEQLRIKEFCHSLEHPLNIRNEMKAFLDS